MSNIKGLKKKKSKKILRKLKGETNVRLLALIAIAIVGGFLFSGGIGIKDPPKVLVKESTAPQAPPVTCGQKSDPPTASASGWSCNSFTATQIVSDGYYVPTNFGCNTGFPKDPNDNCIPACGNIPECAGVTGQACEEKIKFYAANADQYGCNAKLKVTNPTTGKAIVVRVIDKGPACSIQSGRGKFDLSQEAYKEIGADGLVKVEKVAESIALGPIPPCQ